MFSPDVPNYRIDLAKPEAERWAEVILREKTAARQLIDEAGQAFELVPELVRWVFARMYQKSGGLYQEEIAAWARALDKSPGTVTILNCAYELSHLRWPKIFGCTAGVRWLDGVGMVHVRNLDWPLATMGVATRIFRFSRGEREFVSVGFPGQVGMLSGMLPRAYSVTINWAPPVAFPSFDFGPTFLLRDTLETCENYDAAVRTLSETPLASSVFFTVCGTEKDQACIIERTQHDAAIRPMPGPALVQANHHVAERFAANNADLLQVVAGEEEFSLAGSTARFDILTRALAECGLTCSLEKVATVLDIPTVLNKFTCQQIVFCPRSGDVLVWRRLDE